MRKVIFMAASVVYGDYCHREKEIDIRVALKGDRLDISASSPDAWVGVGVPKSANYDEMARGDFVLGSGNELYEYKLEMDYNWKPNVELKSVVENTGEVNAVNGRTNISFTRMLSGPGLNPIDPSKPFNLLFASGKVKEGETGYAALDYHITNRGHARVNLQQDNCDSLGKRGKGKKGGLLAALRRRMDDDDDDDDDNSTVRRDASSCAAILCAANTRCVDGKCVPLDGNKSCADILCAANTRCVNGKCVPLDDDDDASSCAEILCAANTRCVNGKCVPLTRGKKGKKGKLGKSARRDASSCAAILCAANTRCVNGKCVPLDEDAPSCATILCAANTRCVNGKCIPLDRTGPK